MDFLLHMYGDTHHFELYCNKFFHKSVSALIITHLTSFPCHKNICTKTSFSLQELGTPSSPGYLIPKICCCLFTAAWSRILDLSSYIRKRHPCMISLDISNIYLATQKRTNPYIYFKNIHTTLQVIFTWFECHFYIKINPLLYCRVQVLSLKQVRLKELVMSAFLGQRFEKMSGLKKYNFC